MRAHEAGALHAEGYGGPPHWLPWPGDVMELEISGIGVLRNPIG